MGLDPWCWENIHTWICMCYLGQIKPPKTITTTRFATPLGAPKYGINMIQLVPLPPKANYLLEVQQIQHKEIIGTFLYYDIAIENTMLVALNLSEKKYNKGIENTTKRLKYILNYFSTHTELVIKYQSTKMTVYETSDALYPSELKLCIQVGRYLFLSTCLHIRGTKPILLLNVPVRIECNVMRNLLASTIETEIVILFINCQRDESIRTSPEELSHHQSETQTMTDNYTATIIFME